MVSTGENYTSTPVVKIIGTGSSRPSDDDKHVVTVVSQGYSYYTLNLDKKLSFGLYGNFNADTLTKNYARSLVSPIAWTTGTGSTGNFRSCPGVTSVCRKPLESVFAGYRYVNGIP